MVWDGVGQELGQPLLGISPFENFIQSPSGAANTDVVARWKAWLLSKDTRLFRAHVEQLCDLRDRDE